MTTDAALDHALALARPALSAPPAGLLTDLDGTLAPIVRDPASVRLADGAAEALDALAARLAVVGVVTGRSALDARRILGISSLLVIGNHGAEWLGPGAAEAEVAPDAQRVAKALDSVIASVPREPGLMVEHKGLSATVHYRNAPDPSRARARVMAALEDAPRAGIEVRHGRMSVELRPAGLGDKGSSLREVVARHRLRGLLVLGDDLTDLDMFRAAAYLREAVALRAAIVAVGHVGAEVPPEVAAAADVVLPDPGSVASLLQQLSERLNQAAS